MLDGYFYHSLTRKYITLFGALFNSVTLIKYNEAHTVEIERMKVPIQYGNRERYLQRKVDPDYNRPIGIVLPRMAFELTGMSYDAPRRLNPLLRTPKANNATTVDAGLTGVPYNLTFELSILARFQDDANQIMEQILPTFGPDYTITALPLPGLGLIKDIPLILDGVSPSIEYDDDFETIRWITYVLTFTMKVYYYGPISPVKIIRTAFANTFIDPMLQTGATTRVNLDAGNNGTFKIDDMVYQGNNITTSTAAGIVVDWKATSANTSQLYIGGAQGRFQSNVTIRAASTNAAYTLVSFDSTPMKVVSIKTEPNPITANVGDDYGYTQTVLEFPYPTS